MGDQTKRPATYEDLVALPDLFIGQIMDGELIALRRPPIAQTMAYSVLLAELGRAVGREGERTEGWWILGRPELHFGEDVLVPDIACWRRERMPVVPDVPYFTLAPDCVCEVLAPASEALTRGPKRRIHAREGVGHMWLVDADSLTLEVYRLRDGQWTQQGMYSGEARVRAEPFEALELELGALWLPKRKAP